MHAFKKKSLKTFVKNWVLYFIMSKKHFASRALFDTFL